MKHFGTGIIRSIRLYQPEGKRSFCHPSHTILCPLGGFLKVTATSREETFLEQGIILIPSGQYVELMCEDAVSFLSLQLSPVFLMEAFSRDRLLTDILSSRELPALNELLPDLFSLSRLYLESPDTSRLSVNRLLFTILESLDRVLETEDPDAGSGSPVLVPRQKYVDSYITKNIEKQISLQETAATCGLTPQYLSSFFQKSLNCTFMEYVNRIKAGKACDWLLLSDIPSEEVSEIAGFKTYSAFRKSIEARFGCSWEELRAQRAHDFTTLPEEDMIRNPSFLLYTATVADSDSTGSREPVLCIHKESIDTTAGSVRPAADSWRTILNIGNASTLFFDPLLRKIHEFNQMSSFRYCRMYGLLQLVTVYVSGEKTYYGFELVFQNLDFIIHEGLIPFLDIGFRDFPGHRNPVPTFVFDSDPIDLYYEKLLLVLPEFLRASCNRYGRHAVEEWVLEFHFSYQNNRNYTFWQFLSSFRRIESAARSVLPRVCIGGLGFDAALHPDTLQGMLEQLLSLNCQMDFISMHVNALVLPKISGSGSFLFTTDENETDRRVSRAAGLIRRYFPTQPVYITEFGFAHFLRNALNDSLFQACFILRFILRSAPLVQGIGYHMLDDVGEPDRPSDKEFFGCAGLYSIHGLRKPSFYAFSFLSMLGRTTLHAGDNCIVTSVSGFSYRLLAFHYRHIPALPDRLHNIHDILSFEERCASDPDRLQLHLRIRDAVPGQYLVKKLRMHAGGGNLHRLWLYQPSLLNQLDEADYAFFRRYAMPDVSSESCSVAADGELKLNLMLAPLEIILLVIDHNAA